MIRFFSKKSITRQTETKSDLFQIFQISENGPIFLEKIYNPRQTETKSDLFRIFQISENGLIFLEKSEPI